MLRHAFFGTALAAAWLFAAAGPGAAGVIDDFERGEFHKEAWFGGSSSGSQQIWGWGHCLTGRRYVTLYAETGTTLAIAEVLPGTNPDDELVLDCLGDGGVVALGYTPLTPADLTYGWTHNRIEVLVTDFAEVCTIRIDLHSPDVLIADTLSVMPNSTGLYFFDYWYYPNIDPSNVDKVVVQVMTALEGRVAVADVRTGRNSAFRAFYDLVWEEITGPPFPTPPLGFDVFHGDWPFDPLYLATLGLNDVRAGEPVGILALAEDSGTAGGELIGVKFYWTDGGGFVDSFFDVFVELQGDSPYLFTPELSGLPGLQVGSDSFVLTIPVLLRDAGGVLSASSVATLLFDVFHGQELEFANVSLAPLNGELREATRGFDVSFDLVEVGEVLPDHPLFEVTWISDFAPEPTPTGVRPGPLSQVSDAGLWAQPSVTRGETQLRWTRASERGEEIEIYNAAGRRVRRLAAPFGAHHADWDGRNDAGEPVAAGVYLARLVAEPAVLSTRVVVLR